MKKLVITLLLAGFVSVPLAAAENQPKGPKAPSVEQNKGHEAFEKAHKEHQAQMKATQEKMEKLVKEYNKLKDGKKKDAKRAEIEKEVSAIHEEQLKFKADQLVKFEDRLNKMREKFNQESSADGKKAWVEQRTQALIENKGDVRALFDPVDGPGPRMGKGRMYRSPHMGKGRMYRGPRMGGKGLRGSHFGKGPHMNGDEGQLPPPPDAELPVQRPVAK